MEEKHRAMKKLFEELKLDFITPNEKQFLKEYVNTLSSWNLFVNHWTFYWLTNKLEGAIYYQVFYCIEKEVNVS